MWKWKSVSPTTSRKAGYAPDENFQNEALIRVDTVHLNFCENISIAMFFLRRGGDGTGRKVGDYELIPVLVNPVYRYRM